MRDECGINRVNTEIVTKSDDQSLHYVCHKCKPQAFDDKGRHLGQCACHAVTPKWANDGLDKRLLAVVEINDYIASYQNEYFYVAMDGDTVVGYITAEIITENEYNIFPR